MIFDRLLEVASGERHAGAAERHQQLEQHGDDQRETQLGIDELIEQGRRRVGNPTRQGE